MAKAKTNTAWVPGQKSLILVDFGPQGCCDMVNEHAFLVLSSKAFNDRTDVLIGLPISTDEVHDTNPFAVKFESPNGEALFVLTHQPKSIRWREKGARAHRLKEVSDVVFETARDELNMIISS